VPFQAVASHGALSEQLVRQSDSISEIDALDRIAQSRGRGGVLGDVPQAQCERDRALLAVCCSGPSQIESGTPM
jgi:hypothetical protein